jgi:hypothetical protein
MRRLLQSGTSLAFSWAVSPSELISKEMTMTHIKPQLHTRNRIARRTKAWPQTPCPVPARTEAMLRDIAFVLHVTETVKKSLLAKRHRVETN